VTAGTEDFRLWALALIPDRLAGCAGLAGPRRAGGAATSGGTSDRQRYPGGSGLPAGDFVPADLRLTGEGVRIDQSVLTGESAVVARSPGDAAYSGSVVTR
jgi:hypothetical protein